MITAIFLDFDGIIIESVNIKTEAFRELFSRYPDKLDVIIQHHLANNASSRYVKFQYIYENILHEPYNEVIEHKLDEELSRIVFEGVVTCPYVKGAPEFLTYFFGRLPMFLISATPKKELEHIVEARRIEKYFTEIFGAPGDKVKQIETILKKYGFKPENVVYIGDMVEDYRVAQNSGIPFIGREHMESFARLDVTSFPDMDGIRKWIIRTNASGNSGPTSQRTSTKQIKPL
jgi:phosphoglycolate phosphatase-like HAD superfamily hydrolase